MKPEPSWLYPGRPVDAALQARLRRGVARMSARLSGGLPELARILDETAVVSDRGRARTLIEMASASREAAIAPRMYAGQMLWAVPRAQHVDFVHAREMNAFFAATIDSADRALMQDKGAFGAHCDRMGLPCVPTLAVVHRSVGAVPEGIPQINRIDQLEHSLAALAHGRDLLLKPAIGKQGHGIYRVTPAGNVLDVEGEPIAFARFAANLFDYRHPAGDCGYLVQPFLSGHRDLAQLTGSSALATMRVITARQEDRTRILRAFVKFPATGKLTNNFLGGSTGSVLAEVDMRTGQLGPLVGLFRPGFRFAIERREIHPDSGRRILGAELPAWQEARAIVEAGAAIHSSTATLGWDVAYAETGWLILEANTMWGPGGAQAASQRGLRPALRETYPRHWR